MNKTLVLFDGYCNFCSRTVKFIIDRDPEGYFMFASLQSEHGQRVLRDHGLDQTDLDSFIVYEDGEIYTHSSAALRIVRKLRLPWKIFYGFIVVPKPVRDLVYRLFARNRYRLFGKRDSCRVPTPKERSRFL